MNGDHNILNDHGAWASVMRPTTRMSTSIERIQSGIAIQTRPRGRPELNESRTTDAVRQDLIAARRVVRLRSGESLTRFMLGSEAGPFKRGRQPKVIRLPSRFPHLVTEGGLSRVLVPARALVLAGAERGIHEGGRVVGMAQPGHVSELVLRDRVEVIR